MEGLLVVAVPVLIAGFALLMDRFEHQILAHPEMIESGNGETTDARGPIADTEK